MADFIAWEIIPMLSPLPPSMMTTATAWMAQTSLVPTPAPFLLKSLDIPQEVARIPGWMDGSLDG